MNFTLLSPLGFAAGLLALAGGLYLLQRLRVRHREVDVVTTMFWHEAVHETRARVLVHRFRHPWAYALILAIAALLWSAIAAPERDVQPQQRYVFLLDGSAAMAHAERFESAKQYLLEHVESAPREAREVILCGASQEVLLLPGEESLLLEARLEGVEPAAAPGSLERAIVSLALRVEGPTSVLVYGDAPLDEARLRLLPEGLGVERVLSQEATVPLANAGITSLGVAAAESGAWDAVDLLVEVTSNQAESPTPALTLDGSPLPSGAERRDLGSGVIQYTVRDVIARGGRFEARLAGDDSLALDDVAALILPDRPTLRVQVSASLRGALRPVLEADPAVALVDSDADLAIRRAGEDVGADLPALVFAPAAEQQESFLVQYVAEREPEAVLVEVLGELALAEIDATSLADAAEQSITLGARRGALRQVAAWEELIGEGFDFTDSRAFPLFVSGSLRWLADSPGLQPWLAAGEARIATAALTGSDGKSVRPLGASAVPASAGDYTLAAGTPVAVSLLSRGVTLARHDGGLVDPLAEAAGGASDPVTWLLLLAALLLLFEWRQVRTGRMP